jgi:hypothetical protein
MVEKCKTFVEESPDDDSYTLEGFKIRKVKQESLNLVCYTNNNLIARQRNEIFIENIR